MRCFPYLPCAQSNSEPALRQPVCLDPNIMMRSLIKHGRTVTNHAGGVVGGISNGNELVFRIAVKPTSSTPKEQESYNRDTGKREIFSVKGRHDLCIALRVPVVLEAVTALVLADLLMLEQKIPRILK